MKETAHRNLRINSQTAEIHSNALQSDKKNRERLLCLGSYISKTRMFGQSLKIKMKISWHWNSSYTEFMFSVHRNSGNQRNT